MNLYPEPGHKRAMAESIGSFDAEQASRWLGAAVSQEAGRYEEYRAAFKAWEAAKPHPADYATEEGRAEVAAAKAAWLAKAEAEFERAWGTSLAKLIEGREPNEDGEYVIPITKRASAE